MATLVNCYKYLLTTDKYYDSGHNSNHCLKVWACIKRNYAYCGSGLPIVKEQMVLQAAALFHEQDDSKFNRNIETTKNDLIKIMKLDGLSDNEIDIVLVLIQNCSFKKRRFWTEVKELVKMMDLLCSADLAEAVGLEAIDRSFAFHKEKIHRNENRIATDREVWHHVIEFMEISNKDGYLDRFKAISVASIRDEIEPIININLRRIMEIKKHI